MAAAVDAPHQCAVSMEYEIFSASKLPVSYKAAVMKRVNEIKKLTRNRELRAELIPCTTDNDAEDVVECTADSHTLLSSGECPSSSDDASVVIVTADDDAVNMVPDTYSNKNDIALSSLAHELKSDEESGDDCDILKSGDIHELRGSVEYSSVNETTASAGNRDFVNDCLNDDLSNTRSHVILSHDGDNTSEVSVKSESSNKPSADAASNPTRAAVKMSKSVRISENPPTVSYIDCQHSEVCNGATNIVVKVCLLCVCKVS